MTDTTIWIITAAAVIVTALVIFVYRREIRLKFKGHGIQAEVHAKAADPAKPSLGSHNVSIGRDAAGNLIKTGDDAPGGKAAAGAGRNVSIGRDATGNTIVTGDGNKFG
jgi:hypothetical protein